MKTPIITAFFYPRSFVIRGNRVVWRPTDPDMTDTIPLVLRTYACLLPLKVRMNVWVELLHPHGDPIGIDRLHVTVAPSITTVWIQRPAEKVIEIVCDSTEHFHRRLMLIQSAMIAANRLARISRFSDETIQRVFAALSDIAADLERTLRGACAERQRLWAAHEATHRTTPLGDRFRMNFS